MHLIQFFAHDAGEILRIHVAPVAAAGVVFPWESPSGPVVGPDYSGFANWSVVVNGAQYDFDSYATSGTVEIPLGAANSDDELSITGEGIAVTGVDVVAGALGVTPTPNPTDVPPSSCAPVCSTPGPGTPTATPTTVSEPAASESCGYIQDCNFVLGPSVMVPDGSGCATMSTPCIQAFSARAAPWSSGNCFADNVMGIQESNPITRTMGFWQCRNVGQTVTIPSSLSGQSVYVGMWARVVQPGTVGAYGAYIGDQSSCGAATYVGESGGAGELSSSWQWFQSSCGPVGSSGWSSTIYVGGAGNGSTTGYSEVMSPTVWTMPAASSSPTPPALPTATPGSAPSCDSASDCQTVVAATQTAAPVGPRATATAMAGATPPVPLATQQAIDCLNPEYVTCDPSYTPVPPSASDPGSSGGTSDPSGPTGGSGGPWGPGGSFNSSCTAVSWPVPTTPPNTIFPASVRSIFGVGGAVEAAAWIVGGAWSILVQTVIPQHASCDISPIGAAIQSRLVLPDTTSLRAVLNVGSPTCQFFGVRGFKVFGVAHDIGFDGCSAPFSTIGPMLRSVITWALWLFLVVRLVQAIERRVRVRGDTPNAV